MERVHFSPGGTIRLSGNYGYLTVEGWDEPQVEVMITKSTDRFYKPGQEEEGKRRLERIRIVTERRSETELSITTIRASRHGDWAPPLPATTKAGVTVEYQIRAPRDSRLVIHHDSGYVFVSEVTGDIEATSPQRRHHIDAASAGPVCDRREKPNGQRDLRFCGHGSQEIRGGYAVYPRRPRPVTSYSSEHGPRKHHDDASSRAPGPRMTVEEVP